MDYSTNIRWTDQYKNGHSEPIKQAKTPRRASFGVIWGPEGEFDE
jgi:hypothetical protein